MKCASPVQHSHKHYNNYTFCLLLFVFVFLCLLLFSLLLHTFSAFWLRSSVVSVLLSLISETGSISPAEWLGRFLKPFWLTEVICLFACKGQFGRLRSSFDYHKRDLGIAVFPRVAGQKLYCFCLFICMNLILHTVDNAQSKYSLWKWQTSKPNDNVNSVCSECMHEKKEEVPNQLLKKMCISRAHEL